MAIERGALTNLAQHAVNSGATSGVEAAATALERLTPLIVRVGLLMRRWIAVVAVGAGLIWLIIAKSVWSPSVFEGIVLILAFAILGAPVAVLVAYHMALLQLVEVPARLRALPGVVIVHTAQLDDALLAAQDARAQGVAGVYGAARRVMRLARSIQQQVGEHSTLLAAGTPLFIVAAAVAALVGMVEVGLALILVVWSLVV